MNHHIHLSAKPIQSYNMYTGAQNGPILKSLITDNQSTNNTELRAEEELPRKKLQVHDMCADFISSGWEFVEEDSLLCKQEYSVATFKITRRLLDPKEAFFCIFSDELIV